MVRLLNAEGEAIRKANARAAARAR